ncbi:ATP-binding protein [Vibrio fortis]|uniref:ATP-binding protein n=1 Tax=Vibrio fortis TaxID=212667 RepID=UPI004067845D
MSEYNAKQLKVLEGLEPVREKPGMYVGSTDGAGVEHCAWEVVDNSCDEAQTGNCDKITVEVEQGGYVSVTDNGRGIPTDVMDGRQEPGAVTCYTKLHAGGKMSTDGKGAYKFSGGLHGVGGSVVNALSSHLEVFVKRGGKLHHFNFENGGMWTNPDNYISGDCELEDTGTVVRYKLDANYFLDALAENKFTISEESLVASMSDRSTLLPGVTLELNYMGNKHTFLSNEGIADFIKIPEYTEASNPIMREVIRIEEETTHKGTIASVKPDGSIELDKNGMQKRVPHIENAEVSIAVFFQDKLTPLEANTFVNNIRMRQHGKHLDGLIASVCDVVKAYAFQTLGKNEKLENEDILAGAQFALALKAQNVQFKGQTKEALQSKKGETIVKKVFMPVFETWIDSNPEAAKRLVEKSIRAAKRREQAQIAQDEEELAEAGRKSVSLTGILAPCSSRNIDENELFIVEGDSAGGTAKAAADKKLQAVLPLGGKILNTFTTSPNKVYANKQINIIVEALGTGIGKDFDYSKLKFGKIIPLTDADVDGAHIQVLFIALCFKHMPELIKRGHLFIADTPLYKLEKKNSAKRKVIYIKDDKELNEKYPNGIPSGYHKGRFKGLGEMNAKELKETAMGFKDRTIRQLNYTEEKHEFYEELFDILMGDDPSLRYEYIQKHIDFTTEL